ncbi:MAG: polysaccharide deacetylase family protein [Anaerolineae bacterium]|nr:polysaccharide deacetylase family protein [Anaerolineae bacterium]
MVEQLSALEMASTEKRETSMKAITLLYHDVVKGDMESSGIAGAGAALYKLDVDQFKAHLDAIAATITQPIRLVSDLIEASDLPVLLTFDDGGISAYTQIAPLLESHGWRGHFFITTARIGEPTFMNADQIRELASRGHVIGSHSHTHPSLISGLSNDVLLDEWRTSAQILSEIIDQPVTTASVPGGFFSTDVAQTAAKAGIQWLFNSEPTTQISVVAGCRIMGRYNIWRKTPAETAARLARGDMSLRLMQSLSWNAKKVAKRLGGSSYVKMRRLLLNLLRG